MWPLTEEEYDVFELALPLTTDEELKEPPRGEDEFDDVLTCA